MGVAHTETGLGYLSEEKKVPLREGTKRVVRGDREWTELVAVGSALVQSGK